MTAKGEPNHRPVTIHELEVRAESLTRTIASLEAERARLYVKIELIRYPKETP